MSPELRDMKLAEVDRAAQLERAGIEYVIGIVEQYDPFLRQCFIKKGENVPEEDVGERLYKEVTTSLSRLEEKATSVVGPEFSDLPLDVNKHTLDPVVRMGWAQYVPVMSVPEDHPEGARFPQRLRITIHGRDVVDGWRAARGLGTVRDQYRLNWELEHRSSDTSATQEEHDE